MTKRQLKQIMSLYKGGISYWSTLRLAISITLPPLVPDSVIDKVTKAAMETTNEIAKIDKEVSNDNS